MADAILTRKCRGCQRVLQTTEFWRSRPGEGVRGLFGKCKECMRQQRVASLEAKGIPQPPPDATAVCKTCKRTLYLGMFYKNPACKNGRWAKCKDCISDYRRDKYRRDGPPPSSRYWRKYKYPLAEGDYERTLERQAGRCAICGRLPGKKSLHVDHDHKTGKFRALLCATCNHGLGAFKDQPKLLRVAARYLEQHAREPEPEPRGLFA